jgi:hypothetical protein
MRFENLRIARVAQGGKGVDCAGAARLKLLNNLGGNTKMQNLIERDEGLSRVSSRTSCVE